MNGKLVFSLFISRLIFPISAIVAGPDDKWGERPVAFVVIKNNSKLNEQSIIEHCRNSLAGYKVLFSFK